MILCGMMVQEFLCRPHTAGDLPLSLLGGHSSDIVSGDPSLSKYFPMATIVQW